MKNYNILNSSMADYVFHTARMNGTMCVSIVRLFLHHFSNEIVKKKVWLEIQRDLIPEEHLTEFDEFHVRRILEG